MTELTQDLSLLTTVPKLQLDNLFDKAMCVVCHSVKEQFDELSSEIQVDIGFGTLYIVLEDNAIKYKFIPHIKLERAIRDSIIGEENSLLTEKAETILKERILHTYKDLLE